jgi:hypothetical protein
MPEPDPYVGPLNNSCLLPGTCKLLTPGSEQLRAQGHRRRPGRPLSAARR